MTRPEVAYHATFLSTCTHCSGQSHLKAALSVLGYQIKTAHLGITYGGRIQVPSGLSELPPHMLDNFGLHVYHDSSWGRSPNPIRGHVIMKSYRAIAWSDRKLKKVPNSTAEAETAIACKAAKELISVHSVLHDLGRTVQGPVYLLGDDKAICDIITKPRATAETRHFERVRSQSIAAYAR